jgi:hypothetical protein
LKVIVKGNSRMLARGSNAAPTKKWCEANYSTRRQFFNSSQSKKASEIPIRFVSAFFSM